MRQAHIELQRYSNVLGVNDLAHKEVFAAVPDADVDRARLACLSALQNARDAGEDYSSALLLCFCSATLEQASNFPLQPQHPLCGLMTTRLLQCTCITK